MEKSVFFKLFSESRVRVCTDIDIDFDSMFSITEKLTLNFDLISMFSKFQHWYRFNVQCFQCQYQYVNFSQYFNFFNTSIFSLFTCHFEISVGNLINFYKKLWAQRKLNWMLTLLLKENTQNILNDIDIQ